jgi:flagellar hook-associated protein 3 FlgL
MRISTQMFYQRNLDSMLGHQGKLSQQNIHLSTQKRVIHGADDAVAISTIQRLKQDVSVGEQYIKNGNMAEAANSLEDISLGQVTNILQRVRELTITASNETNSGSNREVIAKELEGLLGELVGVANTKDGNSQYIFSGYEVDTKPFQKNEFGTIDYHGDDGSRSYKIGAGVLVKGNDSGASVFTRIAEGNGTFVSERNINNSGSGVLDSASVIDKKASKDLVDQDYTISISQPIGGSDPLYSVYGLDDTAVTGNANVKISKIDLNDPNIANVNPVGVYPATDSDVNIEFVATVTPGKFEVQINGQSSLPAVYDSNNTTAQEITIDGISIEVDGVPNATDQYSMTKYVEPALYVEGQSIEFNGIKTALKGNVGNLDNFTLRQSGEKDIFSTIQDTIDLLRIQGEDGPSKAVRQMGLGMTHLQIDNAMSNVTGVHTSVGSRMRAVENQRESTLDFNLSNQKTLSNLEDLDMASAISQFQLQMSQLEVSQQTFMQLQSLSLFKLL